MKDAVRCPAYDVVVLGRSLQGWRTQRRRATVSDGRGAVVVQLDNGERKQILGCAEGLFKSRNALGCQVVKGTRGLRHDGAT
jgi:hypothetical protein